MTRKELQHWRVTNGLTQQQAAAWYGLTTKYGDRAWRRWESGESPIPEALVKRIRDLPPHIWGKHGKRKNGGGRAR